MTTTAELNNERGAPVTEVDAPEMDDSAASAADRVVTPPAGGGIVRQWETLRHYRLAQLARRSASLLRSRLTRRLAVDRFAPRAPDEVSITLTPAFEQIAARKLAQRRELPESASRAALICDGRFTFLGRTLDLGSEINWQSTLLAEAPRLWRFHFEYHEWLLDLAAGAGTGPAEDLSDTVWRHVNGWIRAWSGATEGRAGDAWHPFCISRRLPVWLSLWAWCAPPDELKDVIARNIFAQAAYLSRRLEIDLGGNHLIENARALALAGVACSDPVGKVWLQHADEILRRECREQVLACGEHFERSPMYHCQMIDVLTDIHDATRQHAPVVSELCGQTVDRMEQFVTSILHPDGQIALLGDSVLGEAPAPRRNSGIPRASGVPHGGGGQATGDYWTFRSGDHYLLFDAGPVGPDHLPAHAHADLLTLEASVGGRRLLVDSGTFDYEESAMRKYCRSTAAHNVLEINGQNQCDVWSRFRMGRRGWPAPLRMGESSGFAWSSATHNAYRQCGVPVVGRWVACQPGFPWLIVDWALGSDTHSLVNRLHLHPDFRVQTILSESVELEAGGLHLWLRALGPGQLRIARGWYCPEFGRRIPNTVIEAHWGGRLPAALGWMVSVEPSGRGPCLTWEGDEICLRSCVGGIDQTLRIATSPAQRATVRNSQ